MVKATISRSTFVLGILAGALSVAALIGIQYGEYRYNELASAQPAVAPAALSGLAFTPGTYTASATGMAEVTVECTFDETTMTNMTVDVSGETAGIGADIGDEMREKFLSAQSCDVDGVSGATITSGALKTAVADCMSQASGETITVGGGE